MVHITPPGRTAADNYQYQFGTARHGQVLAFPLSRGSGTYRVELFEGRLGQQQYTRHVNIEIEASISSTNAPFLMSNYHVVYNRNSPIIATASQLAAGKNEVETIEAVYNWFVENISYDRDRERAALNREIPHYFADLDALMRDRRGICNDYAAGMAAMLRSRGIPTRLVFGSAGSVNNHAWVNIWTRETGWVNGWIQFDGRNWILADPTAAAVRGDANANFRSDMGRSGFFTPRNWN